MSRKRRTHRVSTHSAIELLRGPLRDDALREFEDQRADVINGRQVRRLALEFWPKWEQDTVDRLPAWWDEFRLDLWDRLRRARRFVAYVRDHGVDVCFAQGTRHLAAFTAVQRVQPTVWLLRGKSRRVYWDMNDPTALYREEDCAAHWVTILDDDTRAVDVEQTPTPRWMVPTIRRFFERRVCPDAWALVRGFLGDTQASKGPPECWWREPCPRCDWAVAREVYQTARTEMVQAYHELSQRVSAEFDAQRVWQRLEPHVAARKKTVSSEPQYRITEPLQLGYLKAIAVRPLSTISAALYVAQFLRTQLSEGVSRAQLLWWAGLTELWAALGVLESVPYRVELVDVLFRVDAHVQDIGALEALIMGIEHSVQ